MPMLPVSGRIKPQIGDRNKPDAVSNILIMTHSYATSIGPIPTQFWHMIAC